ncbi:hypothetical protein GYMLUDRAFT_241170 [Collybiopsis luxurians FD-317 M1]|uniref:Extracellular membrane protein CFEM domain-containing protein n=1 Tax=Collybiopsis luxurians FD-317 M1 TaxID=944289 RepID=A0A0D0CW26_9AGAR|nr:hypothetical protein GYMLUDRAFT_241170 [Collybiopsis luxurians FD-317 M1]
MPGDSLRLAVLVLIVCAAGSGASSSRFFNLLTDVFLWTSSPIAYASPTVIHSSPAGRRTSSKLRTATTSDPLASIDFYFPYKDLQDQIQTANILCPAPGSFYEKALSLITNNCPSDGTDDTPISPCCTQDMLTDLAGVANCIGDSDVSLTSQMQSATEDFIAQCQKAGVNGLSDPFSAASSSSTARPTSTSSVPISITSTTTSKSFSSSSFTTPALSPSLTDPTPIPLSSTTTNSAAPSSTSTSKPSSSALRTASLGSSSTIWCTSVAAVDFEALTESY